MGKVKALQAGSNQVQIEEHLLDLSQVVAKYNAHLENGLTSAKADALLKTNGPNQLSPPEQTPEIVKLLKQLSSGFSILLWFGATLCYVVFLVDMFEYNDTSKDNLYLGIALTFVVLLTGGFAYYQESKSSAIMESFKELIPRKAFVLRDGSIQEIDPKLLVIGDIVEITGGNQVPADVLIFESFGCKVDNSSITGESEPQDRSNLCTSNDPMETENMAFFSTYCTEGRARGIVIRTGDLTMIGQIACLTTGLESSDTSIALEIKHFIKLISIFACTLGFIFFVISMCIGYTWLDAAIFFIGIIVANVPEGLLATVTVSLSLAAKSMASKNCLVKNLQAVETLGSTSIICSDKTGTLTQNRMRISHIWFSNEIVSLNTCQLQDISKEAALKTIYRKKIKFEDFLRVCILCNKATFKPNQEKISLERRECNGDASETALLKFVTSLGVNTKDIRAEFPIMCEIPFNSTNKFHLTIHSIKIAQNLKHKYLLCIKGAPERILNLCYAILLDGKSWVMDESTKQKMASIFEHLASKGERVLAFGELYTNDLRPLFEDDAQSRVNLDNMPLFTLLGLASLIDPPRAEVPDAVDKCRMAGIKVFMVTGDHPITAQAIAQSVGIIRKPIEDIILFNSNACASMFATKSDTCPLSGKAIIVPGDMLGKLSHSQLDYIVKNVTEIVFARTSPQQKLLIVQSCQRLGHIVAVTGDGVNDSPALKAANIGIAMGITGSDVSKQAADMILMDDNFASIVVGIEEGRVIFDNLKKSIAYTMASNFAEVMPFIIYVILGFPLALGTVTILCIDLGTDVLPAISLAYEKAESDIMKQKPRNHDDHLVTRRMFNRAYFQVGMIHAAAGFLAYFVIMADHGFYVTDLFGLRTAWDHKQGLLIDRKGAIWNFKERKRVEHICHTAYFVAIVICQWADLIICKTRRNSIWKQGMSNHVLNLSLLIETMLALFLVYCPGMNSVLKIYPLKWWYWSLAMPFALYIFLYDEIRRMILRIRPGGFFERVTYF